MVFARRPDLRSAPPVRPVIRAPEFLAVVGRDCAQVRELREQTLAYIRKAEANPKRRAGHLLNATKYRRFLGYDYGDGSLSNEGWCTTSSGITDPSQGAGNVANDPGIVAFTC
jgi:hypothetical protein